MGAMINSVDDIVTALGGVKSVSELTGVGSTAVSNWKARGRIPAEHYFIIIAALREREKPEAARSAFGFSDTAAA